MARTTTAMRSLAFGLCALACSWGREIDDGVQGVEPSATTDEAVPEAPQAPPARPSPSPDVAPVRTSGSVSWTNSSFHCGADGVWLMVPLATSLDGGEIVWLPEAVDGAGQHWSVSAWVLLEGVGSPAEAAHAPGDEALLQPPPSGGRPFVRVVRSDETVIAADHAFFRLPPGTYFVVNFLKHRDAPTGDWVSAKAVDYDNPATSTCTIQ